MSVLRKKNEKKKKRRERKKEEETNLSCTVVNCELWHTETKAKDLYGTTTRTYVIVVNNMLLENHLDFLLVICVVGFRRVALRVLYKYYKDSAHVSLMLISISVMMIVKLPSPEVRCK